MPGESVEESRRPYGVAVYKRSLMMTPAEFKQFLVQVIVNLAIEFRSGTVDLDEALENLTLSDNPAFSYRALIERRLENVYKMIEMDATDLLVLMWM